MLDPLLVTLSVSRSDVPELPIAFSCVGLVSSVCPVGLVATDGVW